MKILIRTTYVKLMLSYASRNFTAKNAYAEIVKKIKWHLLAWTIFMLYEYLTVILVIGKIDNILAYLCHYILNISLFYATAILVLPTYSKTGMLNYLKIMVYGLLILLCYLVLSYGLDSLILPEGTRNYYGKSGLNTKFITGCLWRGVYFMLFATAYFILSRYAEQKNANARLEKEAISTELIQHKMQVELNKAKNAYLKAQINPHFLFNTLNYIYSNTHKTEPETGVAVSLLSKILRFAIETEHGPEIAAILPEVKQVENLIKLSQIKQPELYLNFNYPDEVEEIEVIPLVLLSLAENMLKHGNLNQKENPGNIELNLNNGVFSIQTTNLINTGINDNGFHTGLENIKQRLANTYQENASLHYQTNSQNQFMVMLKIKLN